MGSLVRRGSKTVFNNLIDLQDSSQLLRGAKDTIKDSRDSTKKEDDNNHGKWQRDVDNSEALSKERVIAG